MATPYLVVLLTLTVNYRPLFSPIGLRHTGYLNLSKPEVSKKIKLSALCGLSLVETILISNISKNEILDITILLGIMM